jgi:hypothetical protein
MGDEEDGEISSNGLITALLADDRRRRLWRQHKSITRMTAESTTLPDTTAAMMSFSFGGFSDASSVATLVALLEGRADDLNTVEHEEEDRESVLPSEEMGSIEDGFVFGAILLIFTDDMV